MWERIYFESGARLGRLNESKPTWRASLDWDRQYESKLTESSASLAKENGAVLSRVSERGAVGKEEDERGVAKWVVGVEEVKG